MVAPVAAGDGEAGFQPAFDAECLAAADHCFKYIVLIDQRQYAGNRVAGKGPFLFDGDVADFDRRWVAGGGASRRIGNHAADMAGLPQRTFVVKKMADIDAQPERTEIAASLHGVNARDRIGT